MKKEINKSDFFDSQVFYERLIEACKNRGIEPTPHFISRECKKKGYVIAEKTIRKWIDKESSPTSKILYKLCKVFDCSSDYLLGLSDEGNIENYDNQYIMNELGLSRKSIKVLKDIKDSEVSNVSNYILENHKVFELYRRIYDLIQMWDYTGDINDFDTIYFDTCRYRLNGEFDYFIQHALDDENAYTEEIKNIVKHVGYSSYFVENQNEGTEKKYKRVQIDNLTDELEKRYIDDLNEFIYPNYDFIKSLVKHSKKDTAKKTSKKEPN